MNIPLKNSELFATIDDDDWDMLSGMSWRLVRGASAQYAVATLDGSPVLMHRMILCAPRGMDVDHRNGNGLDNRRENIRLCTRQQNSRNHITPSKGMTGYRGVKATCGRYEAYINTEPGKREHLGAFDSLADAAAAYNFAAAKHFGEFASFNDVPGWEEMSPARRVKRKTSLFRGVSWRKDIGKWQAQIGHGGRNWHIGYFDREDDAAAAYIEARQLVDMGVDIVR